MQDCNLFIWTALKFFPATSKQRDVKITGLETVMPHSPFMMHALALLVCLLLVSVAVWLVKRNGRSHLSLRMFPPKEKLDRELPLSNS